MRTVLQHHGIRGRAFTLIELLVVISILAILIGILLPSLTLVRRRVSRTTCASNLRQVGLAVQMYVDDWKEVYPKARAVPEPFISADDDPPLNELLAPYMASGGFAGPPPEDFLEQVYHCPGDAGFVFDLSGNSYQYDTLLSGLKLEETIWIKVFRLTPSEVWVARDFDGGEFELLGGQLVQVPFFHDRRNFLFADGHVGEF